MTSDSDSINKNTLLGGSQQLSPYKSFVYSIHSEFTKKLYVKHLKNYMHFRFGVRGGEERDYDKLLGEPRLVQSQIIEYVIYLKEDRKLTSASIRSVTSALHRFYDMNDVELRWKKIHSYVGQNKRKSKDRPYTKEEISRFLEKADQRERVIILLMCSIGMRVGGLPTLRLRNLEIVDKYDIYKITVYENENEEYIALCTPECKKTIDSYLEYRKRQGERLKDEAPLIREEFDITDELHIVNPRPISVETIRGIIKRLGAMSGVIEKRAQVKDDNNMKTERRPVMGTHGFRKFFETTAIKSGMSPLYVRMLMGQKSGLESAYFKPTMDELLEGNDKVMGFSSLIDVLTINEENRLRHRVKQLTTRNDDIEVLKSQVNRLMATLSLAAENGGEISFPNQKDLKENAVYKNEDDNDMLRYFKMHSDDDNMILHKPEPIRKNLGMRKAKKRFEEPHEGIKVKQDVYYDENGKIISTVENPMRTKSETKVKE